MWSHHRRASRSSSSSSVGMVRHGKPGIMLDRIFSEHKLHRSMVKVPTAAAAAATAAPKAAPTACSGLTSGRNTVKVPSWQCHSSLVRLLAAPRTPEERPSPWQSDTRGSHALPATRAKVADFNMVRVLTAAAAAPPLAGRAALWAREERPRRVCADESLHQRSGARAVSPILPFLTI